MKSNKKVSKTVFIYHDTDHCDIEVFDSFKKAEAYTLKQCTQESEWEYIGDNTWQDTVNYYIFIYKKKIR